MNFSRLYNCVRLNLISHLHHFVPNLTEHFLGGQLNARWNKRRLFYGWKKKEIPDLKINWMFWDLSKMLKRCRCRLWRNTRDMQRGATNLGPMLRFLASEALHENISVWLRSILPDCEELKSFLNDLHFQVTECTRPIVPTILFIEGKLWCSLCESQQSNLKATFGSAQTHSIYKCSYRNTNNVLDTVLHLWAHEYKTSWKITEVVKGI